MRVVIIDTETTGTDFKRGDRVIEIGAVEIIDGEITNNHFQTYVNPHRKSHPEALEVHRIPDDFLLDKPDFVDIVDKLLEFIDGADELSFYGRHFDKRAIRYEFAHCGMKAKFKEIHKIDSSCLLQELRDDYKTSGKISMTLDYACMLFGISTEEREEKGHGALLDAYLTAELYVRYKILNQVASIPKKKVSDKEKQPKPRKKAPKYIQTARPIPRAIKNPFTGEMIQYNFCRNPNCSNYGIPAGNSLPPSSKGTYKALKNDYAIVSNDKEGASIKCKVCGSQTVFINNKAVVDESTRLQIEHQSKQFCCSGAPIPNSKRRKSCRNSDVDFLKNPEQYTILRRNRVKRGRRKLDLSQVIQCNRCKTKFTIPTFGEHGQSGTYHLNEPIFQKLMSKGVLNRINEDLRPLGCHKRLLYKKIDFIYRQCIEFSNYQVEQNLFKLKDKSLALSMDRQHYLVNWNDKLKRMPTKIVNTTTTDNESGFTFASTLNFDLDAKTLEIQKDSDRLKDNELHEWLRKYSRYLVTNDDVKADTTSSHRDGDDIKTQVSHRGMLVRQTYSIMAHLTMMKPFYEALEHTTLYADDDSGFELSITRVLRDLITSGKTFPILVREEKKKAIDLLDKSERKKAQEDIFSQYEISLESLKGLKGEEYLQESSKLTKELWLAKANSDRPEVSQWLLHPFPRSNRVLQVKPLVNILTDSDHSMWEPDSSHGLFEVSTSGVDNHFQLIRRRINMLERPITSATNASRWNGYSAYNPAWAVKLVEIFRVYNNYVHTNFQKLDKEGKSRKYIAEHETTPAMRLGLVDQTFSYKDILEFSLAKQVIEKAKPIRKYKRKKEES